MTMGFLGEHNKIRVTAIIAAGGSGSRLGMSDGKQLLQLAGKSVLAWSVDAIATADSIERLIIACDPQRVHEYEKTILRETKTSKPLSFVAGGGSRQESVGNALEHVSSDEPYVLVHDGARPLVAARDVEKACQTLSLGAQKHNGQKEIVGVVFAQPSVDTIKQVDGAGLVIKTLKRSELWTIQTPQIFDTQVLKTAYNAAEATGFKGTDDASLVEHLGKPIQLLETSRDNIKITLPEDVELAKHLLGLKKDAVDMNQVVIPDEEPDTLPASDDDEISKEGNEEEPCA